MTVSTWLSPATTPDIWWTIDPTVLALASEYARKANLRNYARSRKGTVGGRRDRGTVNSPNVRSVIAQQQASNDIASNYVYSTMRSAKPSAPPMVRLEITGRGRAYVVVDKAQLHALQKRRRAYNHGPQTTSSGHAINASSLCVVFIK